MDKKENIVELLESCIEVSTEKDANSFFDDLDFSLKYAGINSSFNKDTASLYWKEVEKRADDINSETDELDAFPGLKYSQLPFQCLEVGLYCNGNFDPFVSFAFVL